MCEVTPCATPTGSNEPLYGRTDTKSPMVYSSMVHVAGGEEGSIRHDDEMPGPAPRVDLAQSTALKSLDPQAVERGWSRLLLDPVDGNYRPNAKYDRDEFSVVPVEIGTHKAMGHD